MHHARSSWWDLAYSYPRYRRVFQAPDLTTQKPSKGPFLIGLRHGGNHSTFCLLGTSKWITDFITKAWVHCYVPLTCSGLIPSKLCPGSHTYPNRLSYRVKEKLWSGELAVAGDQWPIFLYAGCEYDPEDPWNGLLSSYQSVFVWRWHLFDSATAV
jgi:hypothetical protein